MTYGKLHCKDEPYWIFQQEQSANWINVIKILSILVKKIDILELGIVKLGV